MITILLATYNGETFLREQLDSLLAQTWQEFRVVACDDCSTDGTWKILQEYARKDPRRFLIRQTPQPSGSAKYNFLGLMMDNKSDEYFMLCDQDDVWLPEKIEITMKKMCELEAKHGSETPLLVHTDLQVVDETLATISPSFRHSMNANYTKTALNQQLIQNTLTGCTALYNRALANKLDHMPQYCIMHDWWLMLVAAAFGRIDHVDSATILYRQHSGNEIGAKNVRALSYKVRKLLQYPEIRRAISETYRQAESLLIAYRETLTPSQVSLLEDYCAIPYKNKLMRWHTICRLGCLKNGLARKIANFIFV